MPDKMPERMSAYTPESMPEQMPNGMPERMSEYMPERMSDRMSEYIYIYHISNIYVQMVCQKLCQNYMSGWGSLEESSLHLLQFNLPGIASKQYACMCVRVYVCMCVYVCMYVCMYE